MVSFGVSKVYMALNYTSQATVGKPPLQHHGGAAAFQQAPEATGTAGVSFPPVGIVSNLKMVMTEMEQESLTTLQKNDTFFLSKLGNN